MSIKLIELYNTCDKNNFKLIAGEKGLNNMVSWIHMVEGIEISLFVEPHELSFTTGIAFKNKDELFELVKCSYNSEASGFVINIGPFIKEIPSEVIEFCNKNNFPLFEMPWHVYLAEIMRKFCYQITLSDRIEMELSSAIKNLILYPSQKDIYIPQLEDYGVISENYYSIAVIEKFDEISGVLNNLEKQKEILKKIENLLTIGNQKVFSITIDNRYIVLFPNYEEEQIYTIMKKNIDKLKKILKGEEELYISLGERVKNIENISISYKKALNILKIQKRKNTKKQIMSYKELGIYNLFLAVEDKEVLVNFYKDKLEPIIRQDELNKSDYMIVLESYLENNGSIKAVSEELFYHKNTICYKINKIQELINCNLSDLKVRVNLLVALMIKDYIN